MTGTDFFARSFLLLLRSTDGVLLATGDLLQIARDGAVEKRMVFHFTDTSVFEESVVFTQTGVYTMQSFYNGLMLSVGDGRSSLNGRGRPR